MTDTTPAADPNLSAEARRIDDEPQGAGPSPATDRPHFVDSHCHLDFPELAVDLDAVLARARAAGVTRMVTICTRLRSEPAVRALADAHDGVFYAAGTHPMHVADEPLATLGALTAFARHPKFVGIGETGLDYHYTADTRERQIESLRIHIEAARRTGLPLIIHARAADDDMARILTEEHRAGAFGCVMHCFSSGPRLADAALDLGFYLSMSGIAAFPKSSDLRAIFAACPVDRILLETDAPYLAPPPHRGKRNEPAHVALTAAVGATVCGMDIASFARQTSANFDRLFPKAAGSAEDKAISVGGSRQPSGQRSDLAAESGHDAALSRPPAAGPR